MNNHKQGKEIKRYFAEEIHKVSIPDLPEEYKTSPINPSLKITGKILFAASVFLVFFVFISPSFNSSFARNNSIGSEEVRIISNGLSSYFDNLITIINKELN